MKFDEKLKIPDKSQRSMDRVLIILGLALLVASGCSYFVIDAFGQQDLQLDCPKNAYHGLDNQGNEACRDILTNQILEPESVIIIDSNSEKTKSDSWIINDPETGEIILNDDQTTTIEIIILALIGIVGSIIAINAKKRKLQIFQRRGWSSIQKEQVRSRQYGKCNMCFTSPSQWKYDYFDGNKSNNDLNNCQGLCSDCHSVKTKRDNRLSIYQK
ncbi:MAG: hypothetical protein IH792_05145 [Thaumarchaeota archaeon]|nr:hypothetical protein [Nitrososphaerota archaeon]